MVFLYNIGIQLYGLGIRIASLFNKKAKLWCAGRKGIFDRIHYELNQSDKIIWFHTSSLGEFEQGRPVIENLHEQYPDYKICLTFFSPSGYEIRKNYDYANYIFYLPLDTPRNALRFIKLVQPELVFFVKYDFWYHYINQLHKNKIPVYLFSATFRPEQVFFKWYGAWYRKLLHCFTHLFVQNQASKELLSNYGIQKVTICGDTRFDRVYQIARQSRDFPLIEQFKQNKKVFIFGSPWHPDDELLIQYINSAPHDIKYIYAPHNIEISNIQRIINEIKANTIKYSDANHNNVARAKVLVIDNIGMLSSLYKYGEFAYIGGGFGISIHNIQEPATWGLPVVFGPNYKKFKEAVDLIELGGAFTISDYHGLQSVFNSLIEDETLRQKASNTSKQYINDNRGGTTLIVEAIVKEGILTNETNR